MPSIKNTTKRPLSVPLPGGKKLHLGPGRAGDVVPKALEHPPLRALVEAGELEVLHGGGRPAEGGSPGSSGRPGPGPPREGGIRHFGDR